MMIQKRISKKFGSYALVDDAGGTIAWFDSLRAAVLVKMLIDGNSSMTDGEKAEALTEIRNYDESGNKR